MSRYEEFDPDDCSQEQMNYLADHIENWLLVWKKIMIIPDELLDECEDYVNESERRARFMINKLRKGKRSVFKEDID